jgi:hypothetical protein
MSLLPVFIDFFEVIGLAFIPISGLLAGCPQPSLTHGKRPLQYCNSKLLGDSFVFWHSCSLVSCSKEFPMYHFTSSQGLIEIV